VGAVGAGQTSHQSVTKPLQGENRGIVQSKAFGAGVAAVSDHPSNLHGAHSNNVGIIATGLGHGVVRAGLGHGVVSAGLGHGVVRAGLGHGVVGAGLGHGVVSAGLGHGVVGAGLGHGVVRAGLGHGVVSAGLGHGVVGAGLGHGVVRGHGLVGRVGHGVVGHAVHGAEIYPDEITPYTYQYNVADDYSGSNFQATESDDGASNRQGSYSVSLPDGRVQHVNYHTSDIEGYVAEVLYDGTAAYPDVVPGVSGVRPVGVIGGARTVGVIG